MESRSSAAPAEALAELHAAMNRHDLTAFVACFDANYDSEQPARPDRRFRGRGPAPRAPGAGTT